MIRLVGIDVDGTLVGSSGEVHPSVWQAAERACAAGIHLALCSGRPAFGLALEYARRLDPDGWHIFQNGASVIDLHAGQSRSVTLPPESVQTFIDRARHTGDLLELYSDNAYVSESTSTWAREHAELLGVPFESQAFESLQGPVVRAQWLLGAADADRYAAAPHPGLEVALSSSPLMPDTIFVGITRAGVSKGSAMTAVAAEYGIDPRDVMYVGDAENDLSALRVVGHPVAMANAARSVLDVAEHTVAHVDVGGLAQALERAIASR
ncbi:MAG TPA: Cof-type HAD-IIB family hydrolase [Povalibacter sp.]|nr:Cof-type HAD-IIB family hydrolase [Povalibacter sp.]